MSCGDTVTMVEDNDMTTIQKFYNGKNVFITGGTGFLGKVLIEKLLRSTNVNSIYLLVREKKGKSIHTRVDELLDDAVFSRLKIEVPKYKHKVVCMNGDCTLAGLGLSIAERNILMKQVDIVFHVAATVRFDEKLTLAYQINVNGTRSVIDLCRQIDNLKALIHVSTAFANCHQEDIEEAFVEYPVHYEILGSILEKLSDAEVEAATPKLLCNWPNTYAFTKALAEGLIKEQTAGLPVGVFRPAIVVSTYKEPIEAWIDNLYGPTGVVTAVASGFLRTLQCDDQNCANIVPVDTCVAGIICAAWEVAEQTCERTAANTKIYNYVSTVEKPITWKEFTMLAALYGVQYPFSVLIWCINFRTTPSLFWNKFNRFVYHMIPASLIDTFLAVTFQKPRMLKMYKKIHKFCEVIEYFSVRSWNFSNDNVQKLYQSMSHKDQEVFPMSMTNVHWLDYFRTYVLGIRHYLLKESSETLEDARWKQKMFTTLHNTLKLVLTFLTANAAWNLIGRLLNQTALQSIFGR